MAIFGVRCDALTQSGKRCRCLSRWEIPCTAVYDARCTSYRADTFKPVRLCRRHFFAEDRLRTSDQRLKLHHGGWLGAFNGQGFGNLVINKPTVNWKTVKRLKVPKYWSHSE